MEYVTESPIIPELLFDKLKKAESGSLVFHYAVVKSRAKSDSQKITTAIQFVKDGDTEAELAAIVSDVRSRWLIDDVLIIRRIGTLQVGDIISLIAVSSPNSMDAFEACRYGLQCLKRITTIEKREVYQEHR